MVRADVDKDTFKQIFWDHWEAFKAWRPRFDTPYYEAVVHKMLDCGDPEKNQLRRKSGVVKTKWR
jgi:hypothetical protein